MAIFKDFESKKDIYELMQKFESSSLAEIEIEFGTDFKIKMLKNTNPGNPAAYVSEVKNPTEIINLKVADESNAKIIKAPLIGTFYSSPSPDSSPYVKVGDKISKGMVVCIIEAMKIMNEIESDADGEIVELLVKDGDSVEYGQALFRLR